MWDAIVFRGHWGENQDVVMLNERQVALLYMCSYGAKILKKSSTSILGWGHVVWCGNHQNGGSRGLAQMRRYDHYHNI